MSLALWRDVAIVWLALLCLIGMVVPLAVALFAVKGTNELLDRTPPLLNQAQALTRRLRDHTDSGSREVVTRILRAQSWVRRATNVVKSPRDSR